MAVLVGNLTSVGNPSQWTVLFARQPDPDLEFTEEELDQTTPTRATGPLSPHKKSKGSGPILWIFLSLLVGMAYLAVMKPEMLAVWLTPPLSELAPQPPVAAKLAPPEEPLPAPLFGEEQKVTVITNLNAPDESLLLYEDATSTKPGPLVHPGITMTVLDGDIQPGGWMYWVRTDEGTKGWVSEKRLQVKR